MQARLHGRSDELALIGRLIDALVERRTGAVVSISGVSGIGKSRLAEAARGRCVAAGLPVVDVTVEESFRHRPLSLFDWILALEATGRRGSGIDVALRAVEALTARQAHAIVIDDAQWADAESLDALNAVARRARDLAVVVLVTMRLAPVRPQLARLREIAGLTSSDVTLGEFAADGIDAIARDRLGTGPSLRLSTYLQATAGNPFLIHELLDGLIDARRIELTGEGADVIAGEALPADIGARIADRAVSAVPIASIVPALAVVPSGASAGELAAVLDIGLDDVIRAVHDGIAAGVFRGAGEFVTFRHDLVRQAVLANTPAWLGLDLARRSGDVMAATQVDAARHSACLLELAARGNGGDFDRVMGAARSYRDAHPDLASDLYLAAVSLLAGAGAVDEALLAELSGALIDAGRAAEVGPLVDDHFGPFHVDEPVARQRLRGNAAMLAGQRDVLAQRYSSMDVGYVTHQYSSVDAESVDAAAELAALWANSGRPAEALELLGWVEASPTPITSGRAITVAQTRSLLHLLDGRIDDGVVCAQLALREARRNEQSRGDEPIARLMVCVSLGHTGDDRASLAVAREPIPTRFRPRWAAPILQSFASAALFRQGAWDDATAEADAAAAMAEELDLDIGSEWPFAVKALVAVARGELEGARRCLAGRSFESTSVGREWLALAYAQLLEADAEPDSAAAVAAMMAERILAVPAPGLLLNGGPEVVRLCLRAGHLGEAQSVATALDRIRTLNASPIAEALSRWSTGLVSSDSAAVRHAAELLASTDRTPECGRAFADASVLTALAGDRTEARRLAGSAIAIFEQLGADGWSRSLSERLEQARAGLRVSRPRQRAVSGWESLTGSELKVVRLIGEGRTNGEVASSLVVSRRTVESHLGRVYTKLGFTSRAQLVAAAARLSP